jgi:4-hydroxy-2-oxoheptanedioate aldolase
MENLRLRNFLSSLSTLREEGNDSFKFKIETESEGALYSDILFMNEIAAIAKVPLCVKIGGVEALRDLFEFSRFNISLFIAPMVESPFGASKFINSLRKFHSTYPTIRGALLIESSSGIKNFERIAAIVADNSDIISHVIIGRTDLSSSMQVDTMQTFSPDSDEIMNLITTSFACLKSISPSTRTAFGGSINTNTISKLTDALLNVVDYVETRKVVMPAATLREYPSLLKQALEFESFYLKERLEYYGHLVNADSARIIQLESRGKS